MTLYAPIICYGRSGTTLLFDLLCSHPDVGGVKEMFAPHLDIYEGLSDKKLEDKMLHQLKHEATNYNCFTTTYFYGHAVDKVDNFLNNSNTKVIRLVRNIIDIVLSHALVEQSRQSGEYKTHDESFRKPYTNEKVNIDYEVLLRAFKKWDYDIPQFYHRFKGLDIHEVWYRDLVKNRDKTCSKVLKFLGLKEVPLSLNAERPNPLVKQRNLIRQKAILNFSELYRKFQRTRFKKYFEETNV